MCLKNATAIIKKRREAFLLEEQEMVDINQNLVMRVKLKFWIELRCARERSQIIRRCVTIRKIHIVVWI